MVGRDDRDSLVSRQRQQAHFIDELARIVTAAMVTQDQRHCAFGCGTIEHFFRNVLVPCIQKIAFCALHRGEAIFALMRDQVDTIFRHTIEQRIALAEGVRCFVQVISAVRSAARC